MKLSWIKNSILGIKVTDGQRQNRKKKEKETRKNRTKCHRLWIPCGRWQQDGSTLPVSVNRYENTNRPSSQR